MSTTYVTISEDTIFNVVATDIPVIIEDGINTIVGTGMIVPTLSVATSVLLDFNKFITGALSVPNVITTIGMSTSVIVETPLTKGISLSVPVVPTISVSTTVTGP
jgi:hypothetical protein